MDRRHIVLGVAIAASLATVKVPMPRYEGTASLTGPTFWLGPQHPSRTWVVTVESTLPYAMVESGFTSEARAGARGVDTEYQYTKIVILADCASEEVLDEDYATGAVRIDDLLLDCVADVPCARTVCLSVVEQQDDPATELVWTFIATVTSDEQRDPEADPVIVPVTITAEEVIE